ncbi:MAG TPA: ABC transporter ATP-binding protein [Lacipirellulaceae bacterium]|jgi:ABC-2 type transport system ATP-binding protein|nr:ABC transporter ATP-binding protein [Lacipirellulaceae bacterium]
MTSVIELQNVTKRYGKQIALADVSFAVPPGVVFALLGENGAGKSTAIRMMLGLADQSAGEVRVLDLDPRRDSLAIRRRVGYLSERPVFYEWMTAAEIGWFTAAFYPDGFEHQYRTLIAGFQVPLDRRLNQMSKGMRAKVGLSLAMAHSPELLILDEPTSGLDTLVRREFLESMVDIAAAGRAVLLSSHQIGEVERVADIVAILHKGQLLVKEPLEELKRTTRQLNITVVESSAPRPALDGVVIYERRQGRQWELLVRGLEDSDLERLRFADGVVAVESRTPSLEEIFVAYIGKDSSAADLSPSAQIITR